MAEVSTSVVRISMNAHLARAKTEARATCRTYPLLLTQTMISVPSFPRPTDTISCAIAPATRLISTAICAKRKQTIVTQLLATMVPSALTASMRTHARVSLAMKARTAAQT
jgi:hypothetical protein